MKKLPLKGHNVAVNFFDLSGSDDYKLIRQDFYKDANGAIMVFDYDNRDSFLALKEWEDEMKRCGVEMNRIRVVLCGNKADAKGREVNAAEAQKWAKNRGYEFYETSASSGSNVNEAFESLFGHVLDVYIKDKK